MIVIINYGMGNLGSIKNMFHKIGVPAIVSSDIEQIANATKLILPGVGSFDAGMAKLKELGMIDVLNHKVKEQKTPILGICLGMHLLTKNSEEGSLDGLGWIDAKTVKFKFEDNLNKFKIPHMGWNITNVVDQDSKLFEGLKDGVRFYFVHSYYVSCAHAEDVLTTTRYGFDFASSINRNNIFGVQFHPEKSHKYGMTLLKNFSEMQL